MNSFNKTSQHFPGKASLAELTASASAWHNFTKSSVPLGLFHSAPVHAGPAHTAQLNHTPAIQLCSSQSQQLRSHTARKINEVTAMKSNHCIHIKGKVHA